MLPPLTMLDPCLPGIGAIGLAVLFAAAGGGRQFRVRRDMAAWLGLVPAEHSTGGKQTLRGISKRGNSYVRRLIIPRHGHLDQWHSHGSISMPPYFERHLSELAVLILDSRKNSGTATLLSA